MSLLEVNGLAAGYGDIRVVVDVALRVEAGELTVLLGRNGAGKTTTLRAIAGLTRADQGEIKFDGENISSQSPHRRVGRGVGYVQEGKRVFRRQSVENNLRLGATSRHLRGVTLQRELSRVYDMFPALHAKRRDLAGSLSGGQQQMVAIGQALMAAPRLLLLDEPSGGLAPIVVEEMMGRIAALRSAGLGVLLVEQALEASASVADRVVVIDNGRTVADMARADLTDLRAIEDAYFGMGPVRGREEGR